jgi:DNA mismatch endonuclease (patch repair protein)
MMAGIRGRDTQPEMLVRRGLHAAGFRYRLHAKELPGKPDLVLPRYTAVIFVNGCFWHGHNCHLFRWPLSNVEFWRSKLSRNMAVDKQARVSLRASGWRFLDVWECSLKGKSRRDAPSVNAAIVRWLLSGQRRGTIRGRL